MDSPGRLVYLTLVGPMADGISTSPSVLLEALLEAVLALGVKTMNGVRWWVFGPKGWSLPRQQKLRHQKAAWVSRVTVGRRLGRLETADVLTEGNSCWWRLVITSQVKQSSKLLSISSI
ncbi:unnamed protein product [Lota lota]